VSSLMTRVSRRHFVLPLLLSLALIMVFLLPTVGAAARVDASRTAALSGTIRYSDWQFPDTLNFFQTGAGVSTNTLFLVDPAGLGPYYDNKLHLQPGFLTVVPSVKNGLISKNGLTIRFQLRKGLRWSNGQPITNQDVIFGWKVESDPFTGPTCLGTCDNVKTITPVGRLGMVFHMKRRYAAAIPNAFPWILPHKWKRLGNGDAHKAADTLANDTTFNYENTSYLTAGPYQVKTFVTNDRVLLTPNRYYRGPGGPYVKQFLFEFYSDKAGLIAGAINGGTDVTTDYTVADLKALSGHSHSFQVHDVPAFVAEHLEYNALDKKFRGQKNPVHDVRVRQALTLAIDKLGLMRTSLNTSTAVAKQYVMYSPLIVTKKLVQVYGDKKIQGSWDPLQRKYVGYSARAVADAKKLLAKAGYGHGLKIEFLTTSGNPTRQVEFAIIQQNWAKIGVTATLDTVPGNTMFTDWNHNGPLQHGRFQVALWGYLGAPDPDILRYMIDSRFIDRLKSTHAAANNNVAGIQNKVIDRALNDQARAFNTRTRAAAWKSIQEQMVQNAYWVPLFDKPSIGTSNRHVVNYHENPTGYALWNAYDWKYKQ
jgi:peptide/nickel transport system substrate-binding protein